MPLVDRRWYPVCRGEELSQWPRFPRMQPPVRHNRIHGQVLKIAPSRCSVPVLAYRSFRDWPWRLPVRQPDRRLAQL